MRKIKMSQAVSGHGSPDRSGSSTFAFAPEQVVVIEKELAEAWIASGMATVVVEEAPKAEFAVAPAPETAEAPRGRGRPRSTVVPTVEDIKDEPTA